jgi:uncharacterized membrane protein
MSGNEPAGSNRAAQNNIRTVAELERVLLENRTIPQLVAHNITKFVGNLRFVVLQLILFGCWVLVNTGKIPGVRPFDPYPFVLLALVVSCEGVLLTTFVLIEQNLMASNSDHRAHLNLQIDLLAEKEITKVLQLQRLICSHLGISDVNIDSEVTELTEATAVETLASELRERIPKD